MHGQSAWLARLYAHTRVQLLTLSCLRSTDRHHHEEGGPRRTRQHDARGRASRRALAQCVREVLSDPNAIDLTPLIFRCRTTNSARGGGGDERVSLSGRLLPRSCMRD